MTITSHSCESNNYTNSSWFDNKTECIYKIYFSLLVKTLGNQTSLIPFNEPINMMFNLVNLTKIDQILLKRWQNKNPSVVSHKGIIFFTNCLMPMKKGLSLLKGSQLIESKIESFSSYITRKHMWRGNHDLIDALKLGSIRWHLKSIRYRGLHKDKSN